MRTWKFPLLLVVAAALCVPATASAFVHVVARGESLSSVAATDGLSVDQLAAANGLSPSAELTAGQSLTIPPRGAGPAGAPSTAAATASEDAVQPVAESSSSTGGGYQVHRGDTLSAIAARYGVSIDALASENGLNPNGLLIAGTTLSVPGQSAAPSAEEVSSTVSTGSASSTGGGYQVQRGDTLSAIAARYGVSVDALASENGLNPNGLLIAGRTLSVPGQSAAPSTEDVSSTAPAQPVAGGAQPTAETVSPSEIGSIAAQDGVSPALAEAVGYQESGFNNDEVSNTGATGVMQIEPGTWRYIGQNLAGESALSPDSATDNIRGGVLLLHALLDQTGGDPQMALAGYYQGLQSVERHGMYADTQRYVNSVMALQQRFGGG